MISQREAHLHIGSVDRTSQQTSRRGPNSTGHIDSQRVTVEDLTGRQITINEQEQNSTTQPSLTIGAPFPLSHSLSSLSHQDDDSIPPLPTIPPPPSPPPEPPPFDLNERYGADPNFKPSHTVRIAQLNVHSIPHTSTDEANNDLIELINKFQIDIIGLQELNKKWHVLPEEDRWHQRTRKWWESRHAALAYYTEDIGTKKHQPGGTSVLSINKISYRVKQADHDPTGMGRWTSTLYDGKADCKLRVISAYACGTVSHPGPNTIYRQQERYLKGKKINKSPQEAIFDDLKTFIAQCNHRGEKTILLMDVNKDVRSEFIQNWLTDLQIREIPSSEDDTVIPTHNRGQDQIDGLFASYELLIERWGFSAHGETGSDHRLLFADITYISAFGYKMASITTPAARRLKTDNPKVLQRWVTEYERLILTHNFHGRLFQLEEEILAQPQGTKLTQSQQQRFDKLLEERKRYINGADRVCRKLHMGLVDASPEILSDRKLIELIRGQIKRKKGVRYSLQKIKSLEKLAHHYNLHLNTLDQLNNLHKVVTTRYYRNKKNHKKLRQNFLKQKAADLALNTDVSIDNIYNNLLQREQTANAHARINFAQGKTRKEGMTKVIVMEGNNRKELTEKQQIEEACMKENTAKYHQTDDTPCLQPPLRDLLGKYGETEYAQSILDGTFVTPPGISPYVTELFDELKRVDIPPEQCPQAHITSEDFASGWKKQKEKVSASPGIHFGHMKACATAPFLSQVESSLANIPYSTGYSPGPWQPATDVMIKKKIDSDLIEDARTLTLADANWNNNNKKTGRMGMQQAEKFDQIPDEQYGSRPGKSAIDHAIHKRLWYDILRQHRRPGVLCSNDAKSCYDRVVHSIAALAYRRLGIPSPPVECMLKTIQNMKHHIRTSYGDSIFYMDSSGALVPYQGLLQGNGASPTTWVLISIVLINMLRTAGNGSYFITPISQLEHHIVAYSFVDDTDLPTARIASPYHTIEELLEEAQDGINRWEGGLRVTGGAIRPDKSFAYPIDFHFNQDGTWRYKTLEEINGHLTVKNHLQEIEELQLFEANKGKETLGVYLAPDGNNEKQIDILKRKAEEWAATIKTGYLTASDAWIAINTSILKALQYPTPALTLTEKECTKIMAPLLKIGLNACHISRKFPRDLLYGHPSEGGLGMPSLYHHQGIQHLYYTQKHLIQPNLTGFYLRCSLEAATLEVGVMGNLFSYSYDDYGFLLTDCLIKYIWEFAWESGIRIEQYVTATPSLDSENDISLTEAIIELDGVSKPDLLRFNRCRLYLQVITISEILNGFGLQFARFAWTGTKDPSRPSPYLWPSQSKPSQTVFRVWRRLLKRRFLTPQGILNFNIGRYFHRSSTWKWYLAPGGNNPFLYEKRPGRIRVWERAAPQGLIGVNPKFRYLHEGLVIPATAHPATVIPCEENKVQLTGYREQRRYPPPFLKPPELGDPSLLADSTFLTQDIATRIRNAIMTGTLTPVSDGSFYRVASLGGAAWLLHDGIEIIAQGRVQVSGPGTIQSSYCSELFGIMCMLLYILKAVRMTQTYQGTIRIVCDNEGSLKAIRLRYNIVEINRNNADIIQAIWDIQDRFTNIRWDYFHIHSHQDDHVPFEDLPLEAQLNTLVDIAAKDKRQEIMEAGPIVHTNAWLPFQKIRMYTADTYIPGEFRGTVGRYLQSKKARKYWKKKFSLTRQDIRHIDWNLRIKSHSSFLPEKQRWLSKWLSGWIGTSSQVKRYGQQIFSNCPLCDNDYEDINHVIRCDHPAAQQLFHTEMVSLSDWMRNNDGHPDLIIYLMSNIHSWREGLPHPPLPEEEPLRSTVQRQQMIGWDLLFHGFWDKGWSSIQQDHFATLSSQKQAQLWLSKAQRRIWMIAWKMWNHRCEFLHGHGSTVHRKERQDLIAAITHEWFQGHTSVPEAQESLFEGTLQQRLEDTHDRQRQWLASIWLAREGTNLGIQIQPTNTAWVRFLRWKKQAFPPPPRNNEIAHEQH